MKPSHVLAFLLVLLPLSAKANAQPIENFSPIILAAVIPSDDNEKAVSTKTATGDPSTTIIDANGNLKMVPSQNVPNNNAETGPQAAQSRTSTQPLSGGSITPYSQTTGRPTSAPGAAPLTPPPYVPPSVGGTTPTMQSPTTSSPTTLTPTTPAPTTTQPPTASPVTPPTMPTIQTPDRAPNQAPVNYPPYQSPTSAPSSGVNSTQ